MAESVDIVDVVVNCLARNDHHTVCISVWCIDIAPQSLILFNVLGKLQAD